ncbi:GHKL domain-containing protein [Streptococcus saliviloxodontae]|uniref:Two-component system sensor histidine kinase AgrC n=1 Tax=Streptococcus saliviloxodontae TaxID=1349416 RepID=A0ABS2PLS4_9STRE|nr:GHKL domain-containing protein [Streptococcus saliviloxodontae]MBM7636398.1 two-component system sensor histidine kinase AgrC [Streptococcus saliviloxodontae]
MLHSISSSFPIWGVTLTYLIIYITQLSVFKYISTIKIPTSIYIGFAIIYVLSTLIPIPILPSIVMICFFLYWTWTKASSFSELVFYSLYPIVSFDTLYKFYSLYVLPTFLKPFHITDNAYYELFGILLILPMIHGFFILVQFDPIAIKNLETSNKHNYLRFSPFTILDVILVLYTTFSISISYIDPTIESYLSKFIFFSLTLVQTSILSQIGKKVQTYYKQKLEEKCTEHRRSLTEYNLLLESIYTDINHQQKQYINDFNAIRQAISTNQTEALELYLDKNQNNDDKCQEYYRNKQNLENIQLPYLKQLLVAKSLEAQHRGIQVSIEIPDTIDKYPIKDLPFITLVTELFENAINFAAISPNKAISLALFIEENNTVFIIENSTKEKQVDLTDIFKEGYSSKKNGKGMGLKRVRDILNQNHALSLNTLSRKYIFRQRLECPTESKQTYERPHL